MSRTDKTKPWRVRVAEHNPYAHHNHTDGICTLPEDKSAWSSWSGCYWSDWYLNYDGCCHGCGCRMCTDYYARRAERRRSRHQAQRAAQRARTSGTYEGW